MEIVRVAVVEDDDNDKTTLIDSLKKYGEEANYTFNIERFCNTCDFLDKFKNNFDMIFMDICLPDGDGMSAVKKIREQDKDVIVIFVTNMIKYAVKGYEVRAFDYILKPINYYNFKFKLKSALECLSQKKDIELWITNKDGKWLLKANRILYIETVGHMLTYHTLDGEFTVSGSLTGALKNMQGLPFALCNRCYLINLRFVTGVRQSTVLVGNEELQISRLKRHSFMSELNTFLAEGWGK